MLLSSCVQKEFNFFKYAFLSFFLKKIYTYEKNILLGLVFVGWLIGQNGLDRY